MFLKYAVVGVLAGFLSGLFGVGGGILIVPGLLLVAKMEQKNAHGTSLGATLPISAASLLTYWNHGNVNWAVALPLAIGAILGAIYGTKLLVTINKKTLAYSFFSLLFVSVTLAYFHAFVTDFPHYLEGEFGFWVNRLLEAQIGNVGTLGLLTFAGLTTLTIAYNFDFKLPERTPKYVVPEVGPDELVEENISEPVEFPLNNRFITDSICFNACRLSKRVSAKAILTMSFSGYTAYKIASQRPEAQIFVFTSNKDILTQMSLIWGVRGFYYDKTVSTDHTIADSKYLLKKEGLLKAGDMVINIASMPIEAEGSSNMLKLSNVE